MTEQRDLERALERELACERARLQAVVAALPDGVLIVDHDGSVISANHHAEEMFAARSGLAGVPLGSLLVAGSAGQLATPVLASDWLAHVTLQRRWQLDGIEFRPTGAQPFVGSCTIVPIEAGPEGSPGGAVVVVRFTAAADGHAELEHAATHDGVTGLVNRALVAERLQHAMEIAGRTGIWPALLCLDLDGFKGVNDQLGHATGDRLLVEVARRLEHSVRSVDTVARLSGDDFVVLFDSLERQDIAEQVAARILQSMQEPFDFNGELVTLSTSIGIVRADQSFPDADSVIDAADLAVYRAKEYGRNRIETFDAGTRSQGRRRIDLERALRLALDHDELTVVYQPIFNTEEGALVAFEAFVRWSDPVLGVITPREFLPLAEETGLIASVGERVLDITLRDAASWQEAAHFPVGLHVNLSGRQLGASNFVNFLTRALKHHHLEASTLTLELAESVLLENPERTAMRLISLHEVGVSVAIADFGVGYSSPASLRRFMIDVLKVDRQFVAGVAQSPEGQRVLQEIVLMAGTDYRIIAEGVEQPEELVKLRELGFQYAQGYLLAAPMPPAEALLLAAASSIPLAPADHS